MRAAKNPGQLLAFVLLLAAAAAPFEVAGAGHPAPAAPVVVEDAAAAEVSGRLYERDTRGAVVGRAIPEPSATAPPGVPARPVTDRAIARALHRAGAARAAALADGDRGPGVARLVPEDFTKRARVVHVAVQTYTDAAFAELTARVGQLEGFSVVARLAPGSEWAAPLSRIPGLTAIELPGREYVWTEDVTEIGVDGTFHMTARMAHHGLLRRSVFVDRVRRFYPSATAAELARLRRLPEGPGRRPGELPLPVMRQYPDIMFMIQGLVERDAGQEVAAALALARGAPLREATTYLEGGNVLIGTLPTGEAYALVGRDSAAVSRALLEHHRRRPVSDAEVVAAMATDVGVDPTRLFLVEQPWVFHLDMAMTLLAPGQVVLNDALEAFRLQTRWMREDHEAWRPRRERTPSDEQYRRDLELWRHARGDLEETIGRMWRYTERFARYESRALADLEAAGLTVLRVAGRFPHPTRPWDRDIMNFLNGEAGRSPRGGTYFVTQGGDPRAERHVAGRLLAPGTGLDRLYLAPRLTSRDTLWEKGGTGCRSKVEGHLVHP